MARRRRTPTPTAGQQALFGARDPQPAARQAPAAKPEPEQEQERERAPVRELGAGVIDLAGAAALRALRAGLGAGQVQPIRPAPPAPAASSASGRARGPLRYGRYRLDGSLWEFHAALAALRRDTLTGRELRRRLAELEAQPHPPARPKAQPREGEAGSARG
jgi:hypothetical protein